MAEIVAGHIPPAVNDARILFREYADSVGINFCFQGFEQELAELPGAYAPPSGCLLVTYDEGHAAGCVAVRNQQDGYCEMKRLYVRPTYRGCGIGRQLVERIIQAARDRGYRGMRLDTLSSMTAAVALYQSFGFVDIEPYYHNPIACVRFMELMFSSKG